MGKELKLEKIIWIYPCGSEYKYCPDGFCGRYNQLKEEHKRPAVEMSKEWKEVTSEDWKPNAISTVFDRLTRTKNASCRNPKLDYETCAVSDLQRLIDVGKKYGTIYFSNAIPSNSLVLAWSSLVRVGASFVRTRVRTLSVRFHFCISPHLWQFSADSTADFLG